MIQISPDIHMSEHNHRAEAETWNVRKQGTADCRLQALGRDEKFGL